ncbi:hypothetical protein [Gordonia neofelifaecis]|uniref:Uncharacterized protein n=1 Tax=Gordonia neofelifaecis NRRL B-59395 TaxID=644548 RepID=F1YP97_9ACTN|nr:hypothetical protein [Gordonia neofelifaecis]EGD53492.1 hypothetical protein SCNU_18732 [Gordonia neofelifaecis NRRL B-59395]
MHSDDDTTLPAWREPGELPVPFADAIEEWAVAARAVLIETARVYGALITQAELASKVQSDTGIRAGGPVRLWIDELLAAVTRSRTADEPLLASLCVRLDQSVGDAYLRVLEIAGRPKPDDEDMDAATARFACYEFFGATIPAFARPTLAPRVAERRAARRPARPAKAPKSPKAAKSTAKSAASGAPAKPKPKTKPKAAPKPEEPKPKLCPNCFTVLSTSGECGFCY